jgi:Alg9-like mannosyltransferase family
MMSLSYWRELRQRDPLLVLTCIALVPRLLAAWFSKGWFAHDDHFLVIEAAQSWVAGADYNNWLPWNQTGTPKPSGHSFFYVGFHYLLFSLLDLRGTLDPQTKMLVVRLLHALWSLLVVRFGYRIAARFGSTEAAWTCGLFLALFYYMPFLAVRNLVEVACTPFLMAACWQLVRQPKGQVRAALHLFLAGFWLACAVNVRFQMVFFAAGVGAFMLLTHPRSTPALAIGFAIPILLVQGLVDMAIWQRPFVEWGEYVRYNLANSTTYFDQPWYNYVLQLAAMYIPPLSLCVCFGFARWRAQPMVLWLPTVLFIAVHSWLANKQERFILPVVPLFFVLGYTAWCAWRTTSVWWQARPGLWRGMMRYTWALNTLFLLPLTFTYSKRSRAEAMYALSQRQDVQGIVAEDTPRKRPPQLTLFYTGDNWHKSLHYMLDSTMDVAALHREGRANYIVFLGNEEIEARLGSIAQQGMFLEQVAHCKPGRVDRFVSWLNPVNRNEEMRVYRMTSVDHP